MIPTPRESTEKYVPGVRYPKMRGRRKNPSVRLWFLAQIAAIWLVFSRSRPRRERRGTGISWRRETRRLRNTAYRMAGRLAGYELINTPRKRNHISQCPGR